MHKKRHFLMLRFRGLSRYTWNLKNAIFWKPLGVTSSNFQDCLAFMIPTTGESLKKIWEVWVIWSGWFDMELPFTDKWTPSQVFFKTVLSPPCSPPCVDSSPSPSKFKEPPNGYYAFFSKPVGNADTGLANVSKFHFFFRSLFLFAKLYSKWSWSCFRFV